MARRGRHGAGLSNQSFSSRSSPPSEDVPTYSPLEPTLGGPVVSNPLGLPYANSPPRGAQVAMREAKGKGAGAPVVSSGGETLEEGEV